MGQPEKMKDDKHDAMSFAELASVWLQRDKEA